jgi:hypothetical protein
MNNHLRFAMIVTTCMGAASPALAATFCGRQMTPRLEVLGYEASKPVPHFPTLLVATTSLFVSKQGSVAASSHRSTIGEQAPGIPTPFTGEMICGRADKATLGQLNAAMQAIAIGTQSDCYLSRPDPNEIEFRVKWSGSGNLSHTFRVSSVDASLSACPAEMNTFLTAIADLPAALTSRPGTEHISTDP